MSSYYFRAAAVFKGGDYFPRTSFNTPKPKYVYRYRLSTLLHIILLLQVLFKCIIYFLFTLATNQKLCLCELVGSVSVYTFG